MLQNRGLAALALFARIAHYPSLSGAAKALHLTTGALSQQLLQLEEQLGFSLFERHSRGIRLTQQGQVLLKVTERSLQDIATAIASLAAPSSRKEIRLKLTPSFAFKWLVPRLEGFYRQYPDIQIQTFAEGALVDSDRRDFDLAIDYGPFPYPRADAELLFAEYLLPVMSAGYYHQHAWLGNETQPQRWPEVVLLHDAMPWAQAARDQEWLYWASEMGLELTTSRGHFFNRTDMAMSAAEAGVGMAMARAALLGSELQQGRLVAPFAAIPANAGYFLITQVENAATATFSQWLKQQIQQQHPGHAG